MLSVYFPEFNSVFTSREGKTGLASLQKSPTPAVILELGIKGIVQHWNDAWIWKMRRRASN